MLCDDIVRQGLTDPSFDKLSLPPIQERIRHAVKFQMAEDFAAVADELGANYTEVVKAVPFCRLPYREIWIEVAQEHRRGFAEGLDPRPWEIRPTRVGFLLTAIKADLSAWKAHLFWNRASDGFTNGSSVATLMDMAGSYHADFDVNEPGEDACEQWKQATPEARKVLMQLYKPTLSDYSLRFELMRFAEATNVVLTMGRGDWGGEVSFILATLAMMNCRNASVTEYVDNTIYNHKRAKRGQQPLSSHHMLKIHPRQKQRVKEAKAFGHGYAALRSHMVRGHWKVRQTGVFFWRPFLRGDRKLGSIEKTYEIHT